MKIELFLGAFILVALIAFILSWRANVEPIRFRKKSRDNITFYPDYPCDYEYEEEIDDLDDDDDWDEDDEDIPWILYDEL